MIVVEAQAFLASMDGLVERVELAVSNALDRVQAAGVQSLVGTTGFVDRTGDLRASFSVYGSDSVGAIDGARVLGTAVPYAGFLEYGTRYISPRHFVGDAREVVVDMLDNEITAAISGVIGG